MIVFVLSSSILRAETEVDLLSLYKELHANPELSFKEEQTSKKLATILRNSGFNVTENFGVYKKIYIHCNLYRFFIKKYLKSTLWPPFI